MKKKGLIVATIVMVLVLAVSLTTATYAWFSNTASVSVDNVTVAVASASNISLGILKNGGTVTDPTAYINGNIAYVETDTAANKGKGMGTFYSVQSKGGDPTENQLLPANDASHEPDVLTGLGSEVAWNWSLSSLGGVSSSANGTDFDPTYTPANALYDGSITTGSTPTIAQQPATYNKQTVVGGTTCTVIYAPFGVKVEKPGMNYLYCDIKITANSASFWGIVAALKLEISGDVTYSGHPFHASSSDGLMTSLNTYQSTPTAGTKAVTFRFMIASDTSAELPYGENALATIKSFKLRMFIDGEDDSCVANATKYNATIGISFDAKASSQYSTSEYTAIWSNP